jgi:hypothetical protein
METNQKDITFKVESDSSNMFVYGSKSQLKAFMAHLIGCFGEGARLGEILDGSIVSEHLLGNDEGTEK